MMDALLSVLLLVTPHEPTRAQWEQVCEYAPFKEGQRVRPQTLRDLQAMFGPKLTFTHWGGSTRTVVNKTCEALRHP